MLFYLCFFSFIFLKGKERLYLPKLTHWVFLALDYLSWSLLIVKTCTFLSDHERNFTIKTYLLIKKHWSVSSTLKVLSMWCLHTLESKKSCQVCRLIVLVLTFSSFFMVGFYSLTPSTLHTVDLSGCLLDASCASLLKGKKTIINCLKCPPFKTFFAHSQVLKLVFKNFRVVSQEDCSGDSLQIFDGASETAFRIGKYCGKSLPHGGSINSTTKHMYLLFNSDSKRGDLGFNVSWTSHYPRKFCSFFVSRDNDKYTLSMDTENVVVLLIVM